MLIAPRKQQYAIRAMLELARHHGKGPVKISDIAKAQAIPRRFLEVILNQMKSSGYVGSKRGYFGGYQLVIPASDIRVGDIVRHIQGEKELIECVACITKETCPFEGRCSLYHMWNNVKDAIFDVYDATTLQDLLEGGLESGRGKCES
jgi:Rrf2 family transcriptional regulator, cysteine metabolism repressor